MPRAIHLLSDAKCRSAKPADKPVRLNDGGQLYLLVTPDGGRYWRWNYRFAGKQKTMALGTYPGVSLQAARAAHQTAKTRLATGVDPMLERKAEKIRVVQSSATTFEPIAREWYAREQKGWVEAHGERIIRRLERDVFPWIGPLPIRSIDAPIALGVLKRIQDRGAIETAHRAKSEMSQVFKFAIETKRADRDPTADLSRGALIAPEAKPHAAITAPAAFGALLRAIHGHKGGHIVRAALQLAPLVFLRPGELRKAEWPEFDLDGAVWEIPAGRMKLPKADKALTGAHIVPLSTQAVAILRDLHKVTGTGRYVFPSARKGGRPMSENAVLVALRSMGFDADVMTGHGFRASARTLAVERLKIPAEWVEMQLAHAVKSPNGRSYDRTQWLAERVEMMQRWADYCDRLRAGGEVVPITRAA